MKRSLKTKKINELISDFVSKQNTKGRYSNLSFSSLWEQVIGKEVSRETKKIKFQNNTLCVSIENPYLKRDLIAQKDKILQRIQDLNSNVNYIVFD